MEILEFVITISVIVVASKFIVKGLHYTTDMACKGE